MMKPNHFFRRLHTCVFMVFLLLPCLLVSAQRQEKTLDRESPRKGLEEAKAAYAEAVKDNDSPQVVLNLLLQYRYQELIDSDGLQPVIRLAEERIREAAAEEKMILHIVVAGFYLDYVQQHHREIRGRRPIAGPAPADIASWSLNLFTDTIGFHARAAVAQPALLEGVSPEKYGAVIDCGEDSKILSHKLFDMLALQSINRLKELQRILYERNVSNAPEWLAPASQFLEQEIPEREALSGMILHLYQQLLQSQRERQMKNAALLTDLDRLEYAHGSVNSPSKDSLYLDALELLDREFGRTPYRVEVMARKAAFLIQDFSWSHLEWVGKHFQERALRICREGLRLYPDYWRINTLKEVQEKILQARLRMEARPNIYPGTEQELKLAYKNICNLQYTLYRVTDDAIFLFAPDKHRVGREMVFCRDFAGGQQLEWQDTTLRFSVSEAGTYQLIVAAASSQSPDKCRDTLTFVASALTNIVRITPEGERDILVCDRLSGQPVGGVRVEAWLRGRENELNSAGPEAYTDELGMARHKNRETEVLLRVAYPGENSGNIVSSYSYGRAFGEQREDEGVIFTDRAIYRPGQAVCFKGLVWSVRSGENHVIENRKMDIVLQQGMQEIDRVEVVSNEYGSFCGSFSLPAEVLSGSFTLSVAQEDIFCHTYFRVEEYKRAKAEIVWLPVTDCYRIGDAVALEGVVRFYSGVSIENAEVNYTVRGLGKQAEWGSCAEGRLTTDSEGKFRIAFQTERPTPDVGSLQSMNIYQLSVQVNTPGEEVLEDNKSMTLNEKPYSIDIELENIARWEEQIRLLPRKLWEKEGRPEIRVELVNNMRVAVEKELQYTISQLQALTSLGEDYDREQLPVVRSMASGRFNSRDGFPEMDFSSYPSGAYLLTVEEPEEAVRGEEIFWLYSAKDKQPPVPTYDFYVERNTRLSSATPAEVLLGTSAKDVNVLYELFNEEGQLLERKRLLLSEENRLLQIHDRPEFGRKLSLIFTFVKDDRVFQHSTELEKCETRSLQFTAHTFRDLIIPGASEEWRFSLRDAAGRPVEAEVVAGMYDVSLDRNHYGYRNWGIPTNRSRNTVSWQRERKPELSRIYASMQLNSPERMIPALRLNRLLYTTSRKEREEEESVVNAVAFGTMRMDSGMPAGLWEKEDDTRFYIRGISSSGETKAVDEALPPRPRTHFDETAFFYPQLRTDESGELRIRFTPPQSTTSWRFRMLAHTPQMEWTSWSREVVARKEFMVALHLPRFVRVGDLARLPVVIQNLSPEVRSGEARLELFCPDTEKIIFRKTLPFSMEAKSNHTLRFEIEVPRDISVVGCRVIAESGAFSDGEQYLLPVISDEVLMTQTLPFFTDSPGMHTFQLHPPKGITPHSVELEVATHPLWYALRALASLQQTQSENVTELAAAYFTGMTARTLRERNPETVRHLQDWRAQRSVVEKKASRAAEAAPEIRSTPWGISVPSEEESKLRVAELFEENRQWYLCRENLRKLLSLQNQDGGWGWYKGFNSDRDISLEVLGILSSSAAIAPRTETKESGDPADVFPASMLEQVRVRLLGMSHLDGELIDQLRTFAESKVLQYLEREMLKDFTAKVTPGNQQLSSLYLRSAYPDTLTDVAAREACLHYLQCFETKWTTLSAPQKAMLAVILHRQGKEENARRILQSLKEYSTVTTESGMSWAKNTIRDHALIMQAFFTIEGPSAELEKMQQWLLLQKQNQDWGSALATVDAVGAILHTSGFSLQSEEDVTIAWNKEKIGINAPIQRATQLPGTWLRSYIVEKIPSAMKKVTIQSANTQPVWGSLTCRYFQPLTQATAQGQGLRIEKTLYVETSDENIKSRLQPLSAIQGQVSLPVGSRVVVRLVIHADREMSFIRVSDQRAACFEPTETHSGYNLGANLPFYQETKDMETLFFIQRLPKGTHVLEYPLRTTLEGIFQDGIATAESVYVSQQAAYSEAVKIRVE